MPGIADVLVRAGADFSCAAGISAEAPDGCQIQPWWGVSGGAAVPSGLEKRLTATTEALMMAAGEPAGAGRA